MQSNRLRVLEILEHAYVVAALFFLTQGPVYRLWEPSSSVVTTSPQPSIPHVYFATFVAIQLPAVLLVARSWQVSCWRRFTPWFLTMFLAWLGLTVIWSTFARQSLPEYVALLCSSAFGVYLGTRFGSRAMWRVVAAAMAIGLALSMYSVWREWPGSTSSTDGYWIGIYFNRNSLAPVAATALIAGVALWFGSHRASRRTERGPVIVLLAMSLVVLWQSRSQTSPFALLVCVVFVLVAITLRAIPRRGAFARRWWTPSGVAMLLVSIGVFIVMWSIRGTSVSAELSTFNSRSGIWSLSWSGFQMKPWHGWGWFAAWYTPDFFDQGVWWNLWRTTWSHNGYHDLLLGGGIPAAALFALFVLSALHSSDNTALHEVVPRWMMASFVLAAATQESFFVGSHFLWVLLVASLVSSINCHRSSTDQNNATKLSPTSTER